MSLFETTIETPQGRVLLWAEYEEDGAVLRVTQAAMYAADGHRVALGVVAMRRLLRRLSGDLLTLGFDSMHVAVLRVSGANPGRTTDLVIDLTK